MQSIQNRDEATDTPFTLLKYSRHAAYLIARLLNERILLHFLKSSKEQIHAVVIRAQRSLAAVFGRGQEKRVSCHRCKHRKRADHGRVGSARLRRLPLDTSSSPPPPRRVNKMRDGAEFHLAIHPAPWEAAENAWPDFFLHWGFRVSLRDSDIIESAIFVLTSVLAKTEQGSRHAD